MRFMTLSKGPKSELRVSFDTLDEADAFAKSWGHVTRDLDTDLKLAGINHCNPVDRRSLRIALPAEALPAVAQMLKD